MKEYVYKYQKMLRCGYTTGTCAALAAKAAVTGLLTGKIPDEVSIMTPAGIEVKVSVLEPVLSLNDQKGRMGTASCAVRKDAGDDHDVTDGILIYATVTLTPLEQEESRAEIDGGEGIGRVTRKGLDQPPGEAAINSVPREMIRNAVLKVLEETEENWLAGIVISAPLGKEKAQKTFNPVLGITGGISILGTTGIVEPMSEEALVETIRAQISMLQAEGEKILLITPGNIGEQAMKGYLKEKGFEEIPEMVVSSNFIGRTLDLAAEAGMEAVLIGGHIGKLVKLGNGIMNTHSREGDGRIDTLISCALAAGAELSLLHEIMESNTTEEAVGILSGKDFLRPVTLELLQRAERYVRRRLPDSMQSGIILFSLDQGYLGETDDCHTILNELKKRQQEKE